MFVFFSLLSTWSFAQVCITNTTTGTNIYPTSGSPFTMPLWNYFKGSGLVFSMASTNVFIPIQAIGASIKSNVPNWGQPIDSTSQDLLNDANLQSSLYAVLSEVANGYSVTFAEPVDGGFHFDLLPLQIQGSTCFNLVYVGKIIVVSCIAQGNLVFYAINDLLIPIPFSSEQQVKMNPITSTLQLVTPNAEEIYLVASFSYNDQTVSTEVYQFSISPSKSKLQPIIVNYVLHYSLANSLAFTANSDGSVFNLLSNLLELAADNAQIIAQYFGNASVNFYNFGVQEILIGTNLDYIIALLTNNGLQNLYYNSTTQQFIVGQLIAYPESLTPIQTGASEVIVNSEYVIVSLENQVIIFPSFFNEYPYIISNSGPGQNLIINFDIMSNIIITFEKTAYTMSQINPPILALNQKNTNLQTGVGSILITATSLNGTQCELIFNYNFLNPDSPAQATLDGPIPNQQFTYPYPADQLLSPYFYGNNLTFSVQSEPTAEDIPIKQVLIVHKFAHEQTKLLFNQIFQNPYSNTSYLEIQQFFNMTRNAIQLYIGYAEDGISQLEAFNGAYGPGVITAASVGPAANGLVNIGFLNQNGQIYIYTVQWNTTIPDLGQPTKIISVPTGSQFPPTLTFTNLHYLADLLYILTSNPQSLLIYSSSTNTYLYTFQTIEFAPVAVYSNFLSYGNYIFIDNQFELIVAQCLLTGCVVWQSITYPSDNTQQSIGIGLLQDAIYVAITNGDSQTIQFYPKQIIHSTYIVAPIPQTAIIPDYLEISYPVSATFTNMKFYLIWSNGGDLEIAIFQAAYGINNILYYSQSLSYAVGINYMTAVSINSSTPYDIVMTNGYYTTVADISSDMNEMKVWHQVYADFQGAMLSSTATEYNITYTAATPLQLDTVQVAQEVKIVDEYLFITGTTPPNGYQDQYQNTSGLIKIQPEQYFTGTVQNYSCFQDTSRVQVINLITPSYVSMNTNIYGASTGYIDGCIQNFYIDKQFLYQYNPQWETNQYNRAAQLPGPACIYIFNTQIFLVVLCTSADNIQAYTYNPSNYSFTLIHDFESKYQLVIANYENIQNSNMGILAMQLSGNNLVTVIEMYNVTSTPQGVIFTLLGQTQQYTYYYYENIYVITNLQNNTRKQDFYGTLLVGNQYKGTPQIILAYAQTDLNPVYPVNLQPVTITIQNIPFVSGLTFVVPYTGIQIQNSIILACASQFRGGLFELNLQSLDGVSNIEIQQIYTLQGFQGLEFMGLQSLGSILVAQFINLNRDASSSLIAIYQDAIYYTQNTVLNFKGYLQTPIIDTSPFFLTQNGTLIYQFMSLGVTQVYLLVNIYLAIDLQILDIPKVQTIWKINVPLMLTAQNPENLAIQELNVYIQVLIGQQYQINNDAKWYIIGFGLAIVGTVIGWLCYKSRQNPYTHLPEP